MTILTDEQKKKYLEYHGLICPVCGSTNITSSDSFESDIDSAWNNIECEECDAEWRDIYTLTSVENI